MNKIQKVKKTRQQFNIRRNIYDRLKRFCHESGTWNMSTFVDVAINDKLIKDKKSENRG